MNFEQVTLDIIQYLKNNKHITSLGLRSLEDDESAVVGTELRESYTWDAEQQCSTYYTTGETVDGTCATGLYVDARDIDENDGDSISKLSLTIEKAYNINKSYGTTVGIVVIGGIDHSYGNDDDEYIIRNAEVVALLK